MKRLAKRFTARLGMAGAIASAMLFACPAFSQDSRLSLADRVARLEQQTQNNGQNGVGMVNQMQQLQEQVRQQQGRIEELEHHLQQLEDKSKAQYVDLDSRISRLEGGTTGSAAAGSSTAAPATAGMNIHTPMQARCGASAYNWSIRPSKTCVTATAPPESIPCP